ncbi:hypothetical protein ABBQ32_007821 [Trebouxia sp. C0010 RCD-2024]
MGISPGTMQAVQVNILKLVLLTKEHELGEDDLDSWRFRRRSDRSRDRDRKRDRSRDRGYPHRHNDNSRTGGRRNERHPRAQEKDTKDPQDERGRGHRGSAKDSSRGRDRERDSRRGGDGGSQQRDVRGREECPVNAWGVLVSPDNVQRARDGRQVRTVKGEWLSARDSGLLDTTPHPPTAKGTPPNSSHPATTAGAAKGPGQDAPKLPVDKVPSPYANSKPATTAETPIMPAVGQIPVSTATAATDRPQLQPKPVNIASTLASNPSAQPIARMELPQATAGGAPATAEVAATTTGIALPTAASPEATAEQPTVDVYSPIRSPPAANLTGPTVPSSIPTVASLPPPQLNPLPPPPHMPYQPPINTAHALPYATTEQIAAWQHQQQAYQAYYNATYSYTDPTYGYAYSQMTQPHPGFGIPPAAVPGVPATQAPLGAVAPPRPPPLGPNSPPPKHPGASAQGSGAAHYAQPGVEAGQHAAAPPYGYPMHAPTLLTAPPTVVPPSTSASGAATQVQKQRPQQERRQTRYETKFRPRSPSPDEAEPSELPSRDTSSSNSGRAGQNAARAGPNASQGRTLLLRQGAAGAAVRPGRGGRLDRGEAVKGGLDRESSKSGGSSGGAPMPKGPFTKTAGPSRLGPGQGNGNPQPAVEREPMKNGRKRLLQAEAGGSGSQGSHHSPKAVTGSPAKKQKTGMAPATQPTSTGIGLGEITTESITAWLACLTNRRQEDMLKVKPEQLAHQAAMVMAKAEAADRHPKGFKASRGLRYAFQASLLYLHSAAVLQERSGSGVNTRLLEALTTALNALEMTLGMHASAAEGFCNPLQKVGLTLLLKKLIQATLSIYGEAELPLMQNARSNIKMAMQEGATVTLGWEAGLPSGSFQRIFKGTSCPVPEDYLMQDFQAQLDSQNRNIREKVLKKQVREHIRIVKTLAKSPMHGLKPERDELVARLCCVDDLQSETLVDLVFMARKAMMALYRLAPDF